MTAPDAIHTLIAKFDQHQSEYQTHKNETELRREFLDPFFEALGWDVFNQKSYSERFKEVLHEASVEVEGRAKAADYAFRVGDKTMFFVEAKKPSVNIGENPEPAFQLRRYGWSAKLPVSILTDFEQLAVYECNTKPHKKDKASFGRVKLYHYSEYVEKWDEIAGVFSHDAVLQGAFDRFAEGAKGKRGTAQVDDAFLEEIERWRDMLARNIALRNPSIRNERELNYAVQLTIDRIIFLRICEDRTIEPEGQLQTIGEGKQVYAELVAAFRRADTKYNSGLFHFADEKGQSSRPDTLTPDLQIDDRVLKDILRNLYYPESPYVFTYLSADILGQVYERFLGKVIRLTASHQAKVEEKPEVRKAGGVYYTPTYIVDYIVQNTVGKLVEGKTPKQVAELKILDPACGSGSFLLGAYQYLLNWHDDWYTQNEPERWAKGKDPAIAPSVLSDTSPARGGGREGADWRLTTNEKKRILLNNIYGVDIDAQAVEVTKLSLLLKVLEGESGQLTLGFDRVLPDLGENIKCGNSLIGPDYYEERQMPLLPDEEFYRVNAFDWKKEFSDIFINGGFDAVIGNPPYVRQEMLGAMKDYFQESYKTYQGTADLYVYFIERGISLIQDNGYFSYIVANKWLRTKYAEPMRVWLKEQGLEEIVDFGDLPVFQGATTYPCIIRIHKSSLKPFFIAAQVQDLKFTNLTDYVETISYKINKDGLEDKGWSLSDEKTQHVLSKLKSDGIPLEKYVNKKVFYGIKTGLNAAFVLSEEEKNTLIESDSRSADLIKPFLIGREVKRYSTPKASSYLILIPRGWTRIQSNNSRNPWEWLYKNYSAIATRLLRFSEKAEKRYDKGEYWWELRACDYYDEFEKLKIVYPNICKKPEFTIDASNLYTNQKCFIIPVDDRYLLGILNSKLCYFLFRKILPKLRGDFYEPSYVYFKDFPIHTIDYSNSSEKAQHDKLVALVGSMLELHKRQASAGTPREKEMLSRQIESTDEAIDTLVYELYGLTEDEIKIVEERE